MPESGNSASNWMRSLGNHESAGNGQSGSSKSARTQDALMTEFEQLAKGLHAGYLGAARNDYTAISQSVSIWPAYGSGVLVQDFTALGNAIASGNVADARKVFTALQRNMQAQNAACADDGFYNPLTGTFNALGDAINAGNLTDAQPILAVIQEMIRQFSSGDSPTTAPLSANTLSVTA